MLSKEQSEQIKKQIIQQIESTFPDDKKSQAIKQINEMNDEQLEEFLAQNNLVKGQDPSQDPSSQQCIFCLITEGKVESYKIDENNDSIAILEINPISKGHTIIIPKTHAPNAEEIPQTIFTLAQDIAKKIKTTLQAKEVSIYSSTLFGHTVVNVLPIYENETSNSERVKAKPEELLELQKILKQPSKPKTIKKPKVQKIKKSESKKLWLPRRFP